MTLLVTADWQLASNPRDAYRFDNLLQFVDLIENYQATNFIILGDLTEEKNYHSDELVNDIVELFYNFSCLCPITILQGNHDVAGNLAYFKFLNRVTNVHWIDQPTVVTLDGMHCLLLPSTNHPESDWKEIFGTISEPGRLQQGPGLVKIGFGEPLPPHLQVSWIFAHHTFAEVKSESGFHLRGTPLDILPPGAQVVSGDIHTPQTVSDGHRSVTYVGAPYTVDFGDDFEPRALLIDGKKLTSVPLRGKQKRLIEMKDGIEINDRIWSPGDIVKVRYYLEPADRENWPTMRAEIRAQLEEQGCEVYAVQAVLTQAAALAPRVSRRRRSDEDVFNDFAQRQKVPGPTLEVGLEIVKAM